jgi:hypothetical protein
MGYIEPEEVYSTYQHSVDVVGVSLRERCVHGQRHAVCEDRHQDEVLEWRGGWLRNVATVHNTQYMQYTSYIVSWNIYNTIRNTVAVKI